MSSSVRLPVYVTFVRPTEAIVIFGNVSTPFGSFCTLAICNLSVKILRRSSRKTPRSGVKPKRNAKYSDFGPFQNYVWETVQCKLILMTNRKSHMSFRLVPKSVTLNDLCIISPNSVAFWADCVKVVEDTSILSPAEM